MKIILLNDQNFPTYFAEWEGFVQHHPSGTIFQSPWYYKIFAGNKSSEPMALLLIDENNRIKGVLLSVIQYQLPFPIRFLTSRSVVIGGPIVENDDPSYTKMLLSKYDRYISDHAIYSQFRNTSDLSSLRSQFETIGYVFEEHLNIHIDLTKPVEQLWNDLHTKRRNEIRKAEKSGLEFRSLMTDNDFEISYSILKKLYSGIRLPIYKRSVFQSAFEKLIREGFARFFSVFQEGSLIGTMYTFCYKGTVHNWFAGSDTSFYKNNPNDFLPWKIFLWAKENGFITFDWGGAGKPNIPYGVRDYKAKFGGEFVNFGRFEKVHKTWLFSLATTGFRIWQKLKI